MKRLLVLFLFLTGCQDVMLTAELRCEDEVIQVKGNDEWRDLDDCKEPPDAGNVCCVVRKVLACLPVDQCNLTYTELLELKEAE